jgi:hypothetical protein
MRRAVLCREFWIKELMVETCVTEGSVRNVDFGIGDLICELRSSDNGDLWKSLISQVAKIKRSST